MSSIRMPKRLAAIACCAMLLAGGCARAVSLKDPGIPGPGGFLRIGSIAKVHSVNPWITDDQIPLDIESDIYPRLVQYNLTTLDFEPAFASSWNITNGGKTITFHTQPNAEWSDGKPLTAADAAWTLSTMIRLKHGAAALWASSVAGAISATAPNPTTLVVQYNHPSADALANLEQIPMLPEHVWAADAAGKGATLKTVSNTPSSGHPIVSGGPFIFVKYSFKQVMVFKRNPLYWGTMPHIAGFGIELFDNDDALVAAMRAGEVDAAMGDPSLPPTDIRPLRNNGMRILTKPAVSYNDLIINTNPKITNHRELTDPKVRKAFEYATDRNTIDRIAYLGYASAGSSIVPPATGKWYDKSIQPLPYSISKANALLDAAGFTRGSNGIRVAYGQPMSYTVDVSEDNGGEGIRAAEIMATDFKLIGVNLIVRQTDDNALNDDLTQNHYRDFDLAMWGWDTFIDPTYILDAMTCSQWYDNSDSGYCNPHYDHLYAKQGRTVNPQKRLAIVYKMQHIIFNARPYILLQYLDALEAWNPRWTDVVESPDGWFSQFSNDPQTEIRVSPTYHGG